MASNVTLFVTTNIAGSNQSNINPVNIVPNSPDTDYILIRFTEKQNCNNVITALFQNITTNCDISEINIVSADTSDLVNGVINFLKTGRYTADIYYQSSDSNLDPDLATFAYSTCLDVSKNTSCSSGDFNCNDLDNCDNFNAKLSTVSTDGTTITGDGTEGNPLVANTGGTGDMTKAVYDPQNINSNAFDQDNMTDGTTNKNYTATEQTKLSGIENGAEVNEVNEAPNDGNAYARKNGAWSVIVEFLNSAINTVSSTFGFANGDYKIQLYTNQTQWGRLTGSNTGFWESIFTSGRQKMIYTNSDEYTPETAADYSDNLNPTDTPNNLTTLTYLQPTSLTISTATGTLDSNNKANQSVYYTGSGGNITIDLNYLEIEQEAAITRLGAGDFTLVGSGGAVLVSEDNFTATTKQYQTIGIKRIDSTNYLLIGATA